MSLLSPSYGNQSVHTGQQDVTVHRNEVHAKLVAIMRERLNANLKQLPAVADSWGAQPASPAAPPPSSFAAANAKQLRILGQVCISCSASTCVQPATAAQTQAMHHQIADITNVKCLQIHRFAAMHRAGWLNTTTSLRMLCSMKGCWFAARAQWWRGFP